MNEKLKRRLYQEAKKIGLPKLITQVRDETMARAILEHKKPTRAAEVIGMKRTAVVMARRRLGLN